MAKYQALTPQSFYTQGLGMAVEVLPLQVDPTVVNQTKATLIQNGVIDRSGICQTRDGYLRFNTVAWGTRVIRNILDYQKSATTREVLVTGFDAVDSRLGKYVAGSITDIKTGLTIGLRPCLLQWKSLAFYFNGQDDFLYDGTATRQIGIDQPLFAPTFIANIAGNLNASSPYMFAYTYYNSVTGAESTPSNFSLVMMSGAPGSEGIQIAVTPGDPTTADLIRVYRTFAGQDVCYLDGTTAITNATYDSTIMDAGLGIELEEDNTRPSIWGATDIATVIGNRIWIRAEDPNRARFSKVTAQGAKGESFQAVDFVDCKLTNDDEIMGINDVKGLPLIFKGKSFGRCDLIGESTFKYSEIDKVGAVSHHAMCAVQNEVVWLGRDNVYATDGFNWRPIADDIAPIIKALGEWEGLNFFVAKNFTAFNDVDNKRLKISVAYGGSAEPNWILVGSYMDYPKFEWVIWTPGLDSTTMPGYNAAAMAYLVDSTNERSLVCGNSNSTGLFYTMNSGMSDDGYAISWDMRGPWVSMGYSNQPKMFSRVGMDACSSAPEGQLTFGIEYDLEVDDVYDSEVMALEEDVGIWDEDYWDDCDFGSSGIITKHAWPHHRARFMRCGFSNSILNESIILYGYSVDAELVEDSISDSDKI